MDLARFGCSRVGKPRKEKGNNMQNREMKAEYDFSKGERGKFHRPGAKLNLPVYLDEEAFAFVERIARSKNADISSVVNELIHTDKRLAEVIQ